jgi:hypothetical protein
VWAVEVEKVVRVDKEVAKIVDLGFELLGRDGESSDELKEVKQKRFANF